jgi:4-hydroxybenzoate polyprenyltransferase
VTDKPTASFGTRLLDCLFLLRIALLAPVWTILLIGWIAGSENARPFLGVAARSNHGSPWGALIGFSLIVACIYVVNQIVDIESDRINHKLFLLPHGYLSIKIAWALAFACAAAGIVAAFFFDGTMVLLFSASLLLGVFYNLPPLQLKNHAWGGGIANFLGHGVLTFLVGWHMGQIAAGNVAASMLQGLVSSLSPSLAVAAVFYATTIPDAAGDRLTNKMTFCIRYGEKKTSIVSALLCVGAFLTSFLMARNLWVMAIPSAVSLPLFIMLARSANKEAAFHAFKWPVFILTGFVFLFVPVYGILIMITFFGSRAYYSWRFGIEYPTFKAK